MDDRLFPVDAVKRCCTCKQIKPLADFNRLKRAKDGRQHSCRECNAAYHYANWDRHMARIRKRKKDRLADNRQRILRYLSDHPCVDCGEPDLIVLEFDHLRDKRHNISHLVGTGYEWAYILEEIERCDVVCANCHRRRTARRARTYRYRAANGE
jgi:hypothetical protein